MVWAFIKLSHITGLTHSTLWILIYIFLSVSDTKKNKYPASITAFCTRDRESVSIVYLTVRLHMKNYREIDTVAITQSSSVLLTCKYVSISVNYFCLKSELTI